MNRASRSIIYSFLGALLSWQSAVWISRLATRLSWPLVGTRWHDCWDIEHCQVSILGYAAIAVFIVAPSLLWAITGFTQRSGTSSRYRSVMLLVIVTLLFYVAFYIAVWP